MAKDKKKPAFVRQIAKCLESIDRPGDFASSGVARHTLPGLEVAGVGPVGLPLIAAQAQAIRDNCEQAPFGRREKTVVDKNVRNAWQIDASKVVLKNAGWKNAVQEIAVSACQQLGVPGPAAVRPELYKLLLYEEGSFFVSHRDTEKADGMFGTLSIMLPSSYKGGELVVRHAGREKTVDLAEKNACDICYAAFYADCKHEIRPLTEGYRLCLIYNLIHAGDGPAPKAVNHSRRLANLQKAIQQWEAHEDPPEMLVLKLEHHYSEAGLTKLSDLKNKDRAVADLLKALTERPDSGIDVHFALLSKEEAGTAHGNKYCGYEMTDVGNEESCIKNFMSLDGSKPFGIGELPLDDDVCMLNGEENDWDWEEEIEEATGNEGASMIRWYHQAVVVLWLRSSFNYIVRIQGISKAAAVLKHLARQGAENPEEELHHDPGSLADLLVDDIERRADARKLYHITREATALMDALATLADSERIIDFIGRALPKVFAADMLSSLGKLCEAAGWDRDGLQDGLLAVVDASIASANFHNAVSMLKFLHPHLNKFLKPDEPDSGCHITLDVLRAKMLEVVELLCQEPNNEPEDNTFAAVIGDYKCQDATFVTCFFSVMETLLPGPGDTTAKQEAVSHFMKSTRTYPWKTVLSEACCTLANELKPEQIKGSPAVLGLMQHVVRKLKAEAAIPAPQPPSDWARPCDISCTCQECAKLKAFLESPIEQQTVITAATVSGKRHLCDVYYGARYKIDCKLEGNHPCSLGRQVTITKLRTEYERNLKQHKGRMEPLLATLQKLLALEENGVMVTSAAPSMALQPLSAAANISASAKEEHKAGGGKAKGVPAKPAKAGKAQKARSASGAASYRPAQAVKRRKL